MKLDIESPCASCPYRKDAKLGFWDRSHFVELQANDADAMGGAIYGCHGTRKLAEPSVCAGWLLDQQRRGLPSIQFRLQLIRMNDDVSSFMDRLNDGGHVLYESIAAMVEANERVYRKQRRSKR